MDLFEGLGHLASLAGKTSAGVEMSFAGKHADKTVENLKALKTVEWRKLLHAYLLNSGIAGNANVATLEPAIAWSHKNCADISFKALGYVAKQLCDVALNKIPALEQPVELRVMAKILSLMDKSSIHVGKYNEQYTAMVDRHFKAEWPNGNLDEFSQHNINIFSENKKYADEKKKKEYWAQKSKEGSSIVSKDSKKRLSRENDVKPCFAWQRNKCNRGNTCHFDHVCEECHGDHVLKMCPKLTIKKK